MSRRYRVEFRPDAPRQFRKIDKQMRPRIYGAISMLQEDPRPPASRQLPGRSGYCLRIGDYRILYFVHEDPSVVVVATVGHRGDPYE